MWLCTKLGFYSIVLKKEGKFHIRGRLERDMLNLVAAAGLKEPDGSDIKVFVNDETDYRYRIIVDTAGLGKVMAALGNSIDYSNFKDKIHDLPDQAPKLSVYSRLWQMMYNIQS